VLSGNLFDAAIMKTSVISEEFRARYLSNPMIPKPLKAPRSCLTGRRLPPPHRRPRRGHHPKRCCSCAGPAPGYPGAAEVVNMRPPAYLITEGVSALPCIGDGRQSGTSGSPSILNASPEAAAMAVALLQTGDRVRIDLRKGTVNVLISDEELDTRRKALIEAGGYAYPASQTPWQEIQRAWWAK
jgi:dihydroxy-acid dehydratase